MHQQYFVNKTKIYYGITSILLMLLTFQSKAWSLNCPTSPLKNFVDCLNNALQYIEVDETTSMY